MATLADLRKQREQIAQQQAEIDQQIEAAQREQASGIFNQVMELLQQGSSIFDDGQRRRLAQVIGAPAGKAGKKAANRGGGMQPKYQLPSGETWVGRGRRTGAFDTWANSKEGRDWRAANPGSEWPSFPFDGVEGGAPKPARAKKAGKKAPAKAAKKASKKTAKKATKKAGKRASKKSAAKAFKSPRKAAKKAQA